MWCNLAWLYEYIISNICIHYAKNFILCSANYVIWHFKIFKWFNLKLHTYNVKWCKTLIFQVWNVQNKFKIFSLGLASAKEYLSEN